MAGNSQRRGGGHKSKSSAVGSGGRGRKALKGRGPTPKAEDRVYHKAYKAKQEKLARAAARKPANRQSTGAGPEWVIGRNPVLEALHAGLPVRTAYVAEGAEHDSRLRAILTFCADHGIALMQATRGELDRMTGGSNHQGVALRLPEYELSLIHISEPTRPY